jgi:hypothetical protein
MADIEAAGDALTGAIIAKTIEGQTARQEHGPAPQSCLNCGTPLTDAYCAHCGQAGHVHRSLHSLAHDILHGVFHFEGKFWSTLPQLFFFPGRLTRRYIDGERAKFISPMALFLFTVFTMFAVFSFTTSSLRDLDKADVSGKWKVGNERALDTTERNIDKLNAKLEDPALTDAQRAQIRQDIADMEASRAVMQALARGDLNALKDLKAENKADPSQQADHHGFRLGFSTGWAALDQRLQRGIDEASNNPQLLLYKLKTSGYKFSWLLIPLSVPFIWLLFFWRRDIRLYDHAIFATYSITFMMLLLALVSTLAYVGAPDALWGSLLMFAPSVHMYKQLRGAYGLSRAGAWIRLIFLSIFSVIVLTLFGVLLLVLDVIG